MIEFKPKRFLIGLWYFELPSKMWRAGAKGGNWMGCVWRDPAPESPWVFQYRFRYYRGENWEMPFNDPDDSTRNVDENIWYEAVMKTQRGGCGFIERLQGPSK